MSDEAEEEDDLDCNSDHEDSDFDMVEGENDREEEDTLFESLAVPLPFPEFSFDESDDRGYSLPPHQRCAAHTINLVATTDLKNAMNAENSRGKRLLRTGLAKATSLWNCYSRSPKVKLCFFIHERVTRIMRKDYNWIHVQLLPTYIVNSSKQLVPLYFVSWQILCQETMVLRLDS